MTELLETKCANENESGDGIRNMQRKDSSGEKSHDS